MRNFLRDAIQWRDQLGYLKNTDCVRVFYGPGESDDYFLKNIAIDQFGDHLWITQWANLNQKTQDLIRLSLQNLHIGERAIRGAVLMDRSQVASRADSSLFWGEVPAEKVALREGPAQFWIRLLGTKHPGLFLDHLPLREWLLRTQHGARVLNLFAYTGSLSVAAAWGGAQQVTTLDLSKPTLDWAKENWSLNSAGISASCVGNFIFGDVLEWLPKLIKRGEQFDTILCDPPSFSRTKSGNFSTQKDLVHLHELVFRLLAPGGVLVTSINSENVSELAFLREVHLAAKLARTSIQILSRVDLPATFPTQEVSLQDRYLKGFYLRNAGVRQLSKVSTELAPRR